MFWKILLKHGVEDFLGGWARVRARFGGMELCAGSAQSGCVHQSGALPNSAL